MLFSPLDQFEIVPLNKIFGIMPSNFLISSLLAYWVSSTLFFSLLNKNNKTLYIVPSYLQRCFEKIYLGIGSLVFETITHKNVDYFPFIMFIFFFIFANNVIGLTTYSFTITSHIGLTFLLSFSIFIGTTLIGFEKHGINMFSKLLPPNTSLLLAFLLIPIEFISYLAKPISLGVRLFVNLMAGHSLLKIIAGFSWKLVAINNLKSFLLISFPLTLLVLLTGLEFGVALIQTYVFVILTSIYLNDVL